MRLAMFASGCYEGDCVPWVQMRNAVPLTKTERRNLLRRIGGKEDQSVEIVRYDRERIFAHAEDMAVCIYCYERDFK